MNDRLFESFCRVGDAADQLFAEGRYREAHDAYAHLLREIEGSGHIDSYLIAKVTLGLLLSHCRMGQLRQAFVIWNSSIEESLFGIGIYSLEHAQTSIKDMILYDFVCAYLHSVSDGDKNQAANAVNQYMSRVCEHARDTGDRAEMKLALSNWKQHLREIFGTQLPHAAAAPLIKAEREFGQPVAPQAIDFPKPGPWERPEGFREMSRLVSFEPLEFRNGRDTESSGSSAALARKRK